MASPNAQGQLITRTDIALASANPIDSPKSNQTISVITAIDITVGTNIPDTLSAIFAIGAFVAEASLTILMICERVVSRPTRFASHLTKPERFIVAAETASPTVLSTGTLSPVNVDSSTAVEPSTITPSTGMFSPGAQQTHHRFLPIRQVPVFPFCPQ